MRLQNEKENPNQSPVVLHKHYFVFAFGACVFGGQRFSFFPVANPDNAARFRSQLLGEFLARRLEIKIRKEKLK